MKDKPATATPAASDFYPTLPEEAQASAAKRSAPAPERRPKAAE
jgi:hypothetical protein